MGLERMDRGLDGSRRDCIHVNTIFWRTPIASDFVAAFKAPLVRDASTAGTLVIGWS
jgi:hypothetical protein